MIKDLNSEQIWPQYFLGKSNLIHRVLTAKSSKTLGLKTRVLQLSPGTSCEVVDKAIVITQIALQVSEG